MLHHRFATVDQLYPRTTSTIFWGSASGVRAPRDGPSPERKSRRRGGLPIPPRVPCLPALPPPLTACPMLDSLDIGFCVLGAGLAGHRVCFISGYRPPPGWPPDRSAIVDSSARLGLARGRARHAPPWDAAPGGNAPLHCGSKLALQTSSGSGPTTVGAGPGRWLRPQLMKRHLAVVLARQPSSRRLRACLNYYLMRFCFFCF